MRRCAEECAHEAALCADAISQEQVPALDLGSRALTAEAVAFQRSEPNMVRGGRWGYVVDIIDMVSCKIVDEQDPCLPYQLLRT